MTGNSHGKTGYKRISDYAIIGDMHSAALVGLDGSVDWCCFPRFDSPSVFAALLDAERGGRWFIEPDGDYRAEQRYTRRTNVLETVFQTGGGRAAVVDFMPCFMSEGEVVVFHEIHRLVRGLAGEVNLRMRFEPRLNYARGTTTLKLENGGCIARNGEETLSLASGAPLERRNSWAESAFRVKEGDERWFVLKWGEALVKRPEEYEPQLKLGKTEAFWRNWVRGIRYRGRWREQVIRSALTLKLLIYEPSGALVAAATTSLPEKLGGVRNWDYRYSWLRDSAFSLWAFYLLGKQGECRRYVEWLMRVMLKSALGVWLPLSEFRLSAEWLLKECGGRCRNIQIMYGVEGEEKLDEFELSHLEGYRGSRPVRVGNDAYTQFQLDTYGILLDAIYFTFKHIGGVSKNIYEGIVREIADFVCEAWRRPDRGMWEFRSEPQHFTLSKMWSAVGLERAVRMAEELGYDRDASRWASVREEIRKEVLAQGWSEERQSFTMTFGGRDIGAGLLLAPLTKFLPASHPKMVATVKRVVEELSVNGLLYRYKMEDGLPGGEGAFLICSFWLVDCLTALGRLEEAKALFERLLSLANHVGLYSEEVDASTNEALGNFPQAYTHMALINSAIHLDRALSRTKLSA